MLSIEVDSSRVGRMSEIGFEGHTSVGSVSGPSQVVPLGGFTQGLM